MTQPNSIDAHPDDVISDLAGQVGVLYAQVSMRDSVLRQHEAVIAELTRERDELRERVSILQTLEGAQQDDDEDLDDDE